MARPKKVEAHPLRFTVLVDWRPNLAKGNITVSVRIHSGNRVVTSEYYYLSQDMNENRKHLFNVIQQIHKQMFG